MPADLDLKPYRDEHDFDLLDRMHKAMERGKIPKGIDGVQIRKALNHQALELNQRYMDRSKR